MGPYRPYQKIHTEAGAADTVEKPALQRIRVYDRRNDAKAEPVDKNREKCRFFHAFASSL